MAVDADECYLRAGELLGHSVSQGLNIDRQDYIILKHHRHIAPVLDYFLINGPVAEGCPGRADQIMYMSAERRHEDARIVQIEVTPIDGGYYFVANAKSIQMCGNVVPPIPRTGQINHVSMHC
jgi:hypothetical protein